MTENGWLKFQKIEYVYDTSNLLISIEASKWDPATNSWFHPHPNNYTLTTRITTV